MYLFAFLIINPERTSRGKVKDNLPSYHPKGSMVHTSQNNAQFGETVLDDS